MLKTFIIGILSLTVKKKKTCERAQIPQIMKMEYTIGSIHDA